MIWFQFVRVFPFTLNFSPPFSSVSWLLIAVAPRPMTTLPSLDLEPMGNHSGPASGSGENRGSEGAGVPDEEGDGEESRRLPH